MFAEMAFSLKSGSNHEWSATVFNRRTDDSELPLKLATSAPKTSKLHELTFRVFRVPEILKEQMRTAREAVKIRNDF